MKKKTSVSYESFGIKTCWISYHEFIFIQRLFNETANKACRSLGATTISYTRNKNHLPALFATEARQKPRTKPGIIRMIPYIRVNAFTEIKVKLWSKQTQNFYGFLCFQMTQMMRGCLSSVANRAGKRFLSQV